MRILIALCCIILLLGVFGCHSSESAYQMGREMEKESLKAAGMEKAQTEAYQNEVDNNRRSEFIRNQSKQPIIRRLY